MIVELSISKVRTETVLIELEGNFTDQELESVLDDVEDYKKSLPDMLSELVQKLPIRIYKSKFLGEPSQKVVSEYKKIDDSTRQ